MVCLLCVCWGVALTPQHPELEVLLQGGAADQAAEVPPHGGLLRGPGPVHPDVGVA